jgi:hypothetical protein
MGRYQHRLDAKIFRLPERVPRREHSSSDNYDNQVWLTHNKRVTHTSGMTHWYQGCDSHVVGLEYHKNSFLATRVK